MTGEETERCKCFKNLQKKNHKRDETARCNVNILILDVVYNLDAVYVLISLLIQEHNKLVKRMYGI